MVGNKPLEKLGRSQGSNEQCVRNGHGKVIVDDIGIRNAERENYIQLLNDVYKLC